MCATVGDLWRSVWWVSQIKIPLNERKNKVIFCGQLSEVNAAITKYFGSRRPTDSLSDEPSKMSEKSFFLAVFIEITFTLLFHHLYCIHHTVYCILYTVH